MNSPMHPATTPSSGPTRLRFGIYELDLRSGELRKAGARLKLQPQPFKVLAILASRAGETVTREELQRQVWGEELFVDFERGLNVCIQQIRGALNDEAATPRYIETLPKRGYRFLAPVEKLSVASQGLPADKPQVASSSAGASQQLLGSSAHRNHKVFRLSAITICIILLAAIPLFLARIPRWSRMRLAVKPIRSVAVLPFANFSGDPEQQYFADGMTEALIAQLGQIRGLRVPSRTSVMLYKRANKPLPEIARELGVDALVEGSVSRSGDHVGITVQLLDGLRDQHIWGGTYNRDFRDVIALQDELARAITTELKVSFNPDDQLHGNTSRSVNADAYTAYLHGRYYWYKRTIEGFQKSIQYYQQAVVADPNYAPSYAGLADAYALLGSSPNDIIPPNEAMPKAKAAAWKALQLDNGLAEAHASLAYVSMVYDWDWPKAEQEFQRAIAINPSYSGAHEWYAEFLAARGREKEALSEMNRARDADPLLVLMHAAVAEALYYSRRYDDVISQCQQTLELDPSYPIAHFHLGRAYLAKNMFSEAVVEYQKAKATLGETPAIVMAMGYANAKAGNRAAARRALEDLREQSKQRYVPALYFAAIYTGLGDANSGISWLEKAYREHSDYLIYLNVDPMADTLRPNKRFQEILNRVGLETSSTGA